MLELTLPALNLKMKEKSIEVQLPGVKKNISLKNHTTFRVGGKAKYFFEAKTKEDIIRSVKKANLLKLPFFILGEGSNILVSDSGFKGLVIKIQNSKLKIKNPRLYAEAGTPMKQLVEETGKLGLLGLEWAGGLPGTLGGAVRGNAGAFGGEIKDSIVKVEAIDKSGRVMKLSKKECEFSYRSSIFKQKNWIVLSALFRLEKGVKKETQKTALDHIQYRKEKHPLEYPNAGSIFKNCDLKKIPVSHIKIFYGAVKTDPFLVVPSAFIISEAGLKGKKIGKAEISKKHPNYIINRGGARAKDVIQLINLAKEEVKKKFNIVLEDEIQYLGFSTLDNKS